MLRIPLTPRVLEFLIILAKTLDVIFVPVCHAGENRSQALYHLLVDRGFNVTPPHGADTGRDFHDQSLTYWFSTPVDTVDPILPGGKRRVLRWHDHLTLKMAVLPPESVPEGVVTDRTFINELRDLFTRTLYTPGYIRENLHLPGAMVVYITFCRAGGIVESRLKEANGGSIPDNVLVINLEMPDYCTDGEPEPHLRMYQKLGELFGFPDSDASSGGASGSAIPPCPECERVGPFDGTRCHTADGGCDYTQVEGDGWKCGACTLHNESTVTTCAVCGTTKPPM